MVVPSDPPQSTTPDIEFQKLLDAVQKLRPADDTKQLIAAYEFAKGLHEGQFRKSGEPYLMHPIAVAEILVDAQMDMTCLVTAMLHDIVEDTPTPIEEIHKRFGEEVARCVDGVTKLSKVNLYSVEQRQAESVRKMLLAMVTDIRVILVKFADRLHNMRTLDALRPEQQTRIAQETIEIYAPLAHRLGMARSVANSKTLRSDTSNRKRPRISSGKSSPAVPPMNSTSPRLSRPWRRA
jgi:GTP diphosphokinase / guanosine-3',5'-bis(diphosphate) 3'-diphosphatase